MRIGGMSGGDAALFFCLRPSLRNTPRSFSACRDRSAYPSMAKQNKSLHHAGVDDTEAEKVSIAREERSVRRI